MTGAASLILLLGLGLHASSVHSLLEARSCSQDNCLRALENSKYSSSASAFCTSFLSASLPTTASPSVPAFLGNCGTTTSISRLSSACECLLSTTAAPTSPTTTSSTSSSLTSTTTTATTTSASTCPLASTITSTVTLITSSQSSCPAVSPSTITLPASTITAPAATVTTTITATATTLSLCPAGELITNGNFEIPGTDTTYPPGWTVSVDGPGAEGVDFGVDCDNPGVFSESGNCGFFAAFPPDSSGTTLKLLQGVEQCNAGYYTYDLYYKVGPGCNLQSWSGGTMDFSVSGTGTTFPTDWTQFQEAEFFGQTPTAVFTNDIYYLISPVGSESCSVYIDNVQYYTSG